MAEKEYIERGAFRKKLIDRQITDAFFDNVRRDEIGHIVNVLDNSPAADVVEVVRCKDCKHFTQGMAVGICYRVKDKPLIPCCYDHFLQLWREKGGANE